MTRHVAKKRAIPIYRELNICNKAPGIFINKLQIGRQQSNKGLPQTNSKTVQNFIKQLMSHEKLVKGVLHRQHLKM